MVCCSVMVAATEILWLIKLSDPTADPELIKVYNLAAFSDTSCANETEEVLMEGMFLHSL